MGDNVTSVTELADKLYKASKSVDINFKEGDSLVDVSNRAYTCVVTATLSRICANANDLMLPLSVVKQLLKGTNYEQYI